LLREKLARQKAIQDRQIEEQAKQMKVNQRIIELLQIQAGKSGPHYNTKRASDQNSTSKPEVTSPGITTTGASRPLPPEGVLIDLSEPTQARQDHGSSNSKESGPRDGSSNEGTRRESNTELLRRCFSADVAETDYGAKPGEDASPTEQW